MNLRIQAVVVVALAAAKSMGRTDLAAVDFRANQDRHTVRAHLYITC